MVHKYYGYKYYGLLCMMNKEIYVIFGVVVFNFRFNFDIPVFANLPNNVCERGVCEISF